jgi:hypothetical protein
VLAIDPDLRTVGLLYEKDLPADCAGLRGKWSGGVISAKDGCMYCVPYNAPCVLKVCKKAGVEARCQERERKGYFQDYASFLCCFLDVFQIMWAVGIKLKKRA